MRRIALWFISTSFLLSSSVLGRFDIRNFGAIPDDDSLAAEWANSAAIMQAFVAANYTSSEEREIYIPENMTFHSMPVSAARVNNLTIMIDGTLKASKRNNLWPLHGKVHDFMEFAWCNDLKFRGKGTIDGQGYMWWVREYLG